MLSSHLFALLIDHRLKVVLVVLEQDILLLFEAFLLLLLAQLVLKGQILKLLLLLFLQQLQLSELLKSKVHK